MEEGHQPGEGDGPGPGPEAGPAPSDGPAASGAPEDRQIPSRLVNQGPGLMRLVRWWRRIPRQIKWTFSVIVLIFVFEYILLPEVASARKSIHLLGEVNVIGLIFAVLLEAVALGAYAELTHTVLTPESPRRFTIFRINMSSLAVSHVVPGGTAPGTALAYRLLTDEGVRGSTAAFGLASQGVGSAVVLNGIFWLALLISVPLNGYNPLYGFAGIAGVILFVLFAGTIYLLTRGKRQAADRLHGVADRLPFVNPDVLSSLVQRIADRLQALLADRALLVHALEWAAANWLFDAASLWVFIAAFGNVMSPVDLLVAYGLANILAALPITPGGLGIVEGVLIPTLVGFHVPREIALLGVLTYRLVNFWLPIPVGGAAYLSLRFRHRGRELGQRAA